MKSRLNTSVYVWFISGFMARPDHVVQPLYAHQQGRWPDFTCVSTSLFISTFH